MFFVLTLPVSASSLESRVENTQEALLAFDVIREQRTSPGMWHLKKYRSDGPGLEITLKM